MECDKVPQWYIKLCEQSIFNKFRPIVAEQLSVEINKVVPEASFANDFDADELDALDLLMAVEEEFDIEIPDEVVYEIHTVKDAVNCMMRYLPAEQHDLNAVLDATSDLLEKHHIKETDDINPFISEAINNESIEKRNKIRKISSLLHELKLIERAEVNELIDCAMDSEYMLSIEKIEDIHSLLKSTILGNLTNLDEDDYQQFFILALEKSKDKKKKELEKSLEHLKSSANNIKTEISNHKTKIAGREDDFIKIAEQIQKLQSSIQEIG